MTKQLDLTGNANLFGGYGSWGNVYDDEPIGQSTATKKASAGTYKRCYESHPPLRVGKFEIFGGNCANPIVHDADIYIGFDPCMRFTTRSNPWVENPIQEVYFEIRDMCAPKDPKDFALMVDWVCNQLQSGKKIHLGCIGGHGRTGTVLSAIVKTMTGEVDATTYVRANYCKKAVESQVQIDFLHKHFGIKKVEASKVHFVEYPSSKKSVSGVATNYTKSNGYTGSSGSSKSSGKVSTQIMPVSSKKSIWGS